MTSSDDRIVRFHDELTAWLDRQLDAQSEKLLWGHRDVARAVFNYLWYSHLQLREGYMHHGGKDYLDRITLNIPAPPDGHRAMIESDLAGHPWRGTLEAFHDHILVYADNPRHIRHLLPVMRFFKEREQPVVLLTRTEDLPDEVACEQIRPLYFTPMISQAVTTSGLAGISRELAAFTHTLLCYIQWMRPKAMICCDGCQTQYQLAAIYCRGLGIPAICCQLGWPGFIHAGFRQLPYSHFLTWGEAFSVLLGEASPLTGFHAIGRLEPVDSQGSHDAITFFMQAPVFVSSEEYHARFLKLVEATAQRYPSRRIIVRPHPEYDDTARTSATAATHRNITIDTAPLTANTYRMTDIAVSMFSSCLVESAAFGCVPLMFNPTSGFEYPLLPEELKTRDEESFFDRLDDIMQHPGGRCATGHIQYSGKECLARFAASIQSII